MQPVPMTQVYILCPVDGGDLELDPGLRNREMVCRRCGARYPFTPDLLGHQRLREMNRA